jgi:hypothetical protein
VSQLSVVEGERESLARRLRSLQKTLEEVKAKSDAAAEVQMQVVEAAVVARVGELDRLKATDRLIICEVRAACQAKLSLRWRCDTVAPWWSPSQATAHAHADTALRAVQLREDAEKQEAKLRQEIRRLQAEAADANERARVADEMRAKKIEAVKELKQLLNNSHQQIESGKLQIQRLSAMLGKMSRSR